MRPLLEQWIVQLQRLIIAGKWLAALLPKASTANTAAALGMRYSCTHAAIAMGLWLQLVTCKTDAYLPHFIKISLCC
eukprot:14524-Heterococcus_DN1.PRE.1